MKAMVLKAANTPFVLETVPDPVPGPGEAVAQVLACGSGLTIQHYKAGRTSATFPRIIGHEITGEIVELGANVSGLEEGDAVTAYYYLYCGYCRWCLANLEPLCENLAGNVGRDCDGGYAEYIKLRADMFLKLPEGLDHRQHPAEIGVVTDAIATPFKVVRRARIRPGETVAVFGAGGGLGIHMVMLARWARARVIAVDLVSDKFDACREAGADEVVDASGGDVAEALLNLTGDAGSTWRSTSSPPPRRWRRQRGRSGAREDWSRWAAPARTSALRPWPCCSTSRTCSAAATSAASR